MAKIEIKKQKQFAVNNSGQIGQFGSAQAGTKVTSIDPDVLQNLSAFEDGWSAATVSGQNLPPLEEFNGLAYLTTRQIAYGLQEGIPEYSADIEYHQKSIVKKTGTYELYGSITNNNQGNALTDAANWQLLTDLSSTAANPNLIINGQGLIGQRGLSFTSSTTPSNSDDTYLLDRMLLLSDGNDIVDVSRETSEVPQGAYSSIKFDVETANKQFAYCQIFEAKQAVKIIGGNASLSFKAKKGGSNATLETLRAAIISWDGTEDSVTSDLVATWAGAGTNPTLASNWTYENTPSDLTLTTSFQTFKIENVSIDTASAKNVAVLIWCDDTDATVGDLAYIGDIKLEEGSIATPYKSESIENIILKCQRFYEKSYNLDVVPATITYDGVYNFRSVSTYDTRTIIFKAMKRANPSIVIYNPITGATGTWRNGSRSTDDAVTAASPAEQGYIAATSGHTAPGDSIVGHWTADAEL